MVPRSPKSTAPVSDPSHGVGTRGEQTRARIEQAALNLFEQQGFRTTTMREITSACKLTPGAFYNHFPAKEDLLFSLILGAFQQLEISVSSAVAKAGDSPTERLTAYVRAITIWHCKNAKQARVANRETLELAPEMLNSVLSRRRSLRSIAEQIITGGSENGSFDLPGQNVPAVSKVLATALLDLARVASESHFETSTWRPDELADLHATIALRMVGQQNEKRSDTRDIVPDVVTV
jgi:AcrR family transcriptional regulator